MISSPKLPVVRWTASVALDGQQVAVAGLQEPAVEGAQVVGHFFRAAVDRGTVQEGGGSIHLLPGA